MVAFVSREDEQGVGGSDAVFGQALEEDTKGLVVGFQCGNVTSLTRAVGGTIGMGIVRVRDVGVGDGYAVFLHGRDIGERNGCGHTIKAWEANIAMRVLNDIAEKVCHRAIGTDLWRNIFIAIECLVAVVTARLAWQDIGLRIAGVRAYRIIEGAVNANAHKIGSRLIGIVLYLLSLGRIGSEDGRNIGADILEDGVGSGNRANVTTGARVGNPGRGRVFPIGGQHVIGRIGGRRCSGIVNRI